jgi:hypothetical protein
MVVLAAAVAFLFLFLAAADFLVGQFNAEELTNMGVQQK